VALTIYTDISPSWVAWREATVFGSPAVQIPRPQSAGDVVGRDLAFTGLGPIGHIGMFDGENVMQVMNER
jgi:hypothetical protein